MIFILIEQILNGTVTLDVSIKGIEAETFTDAVSHLREMPNFRLAKNIYQDNKSFSYYIPNAMGDVYGIMKNNILEFI